MVFRSLVSFVAAILMAGPAAAETIAIIGTGMMGGALGPRLAGLGHFPLASSLPR
jgi:hypothetical protein